jgi:hypothetical protein
MMSWVATFLLGAAFGSSTLMLSQMLLAARRLRRGSTSAHHPPDEPRGVDLDRLSAAERCRILGD